MVYQKKHIVLTTRLQEGVYFDSRRVFMSFGQKAKAAGSVVQAVMKQPGTWELPVVEALREGKQEDSSGEVGRRINSVMGDPNVPTDVKTMLNATDLNDPRSVWTAANMLAQQGYWTKSLS